MHSTARASTERVESHDTALAQQSLSKTRVCTQRTCLTALREPLRSLFLLPLTCAGLDTWLCFLLCLRSPLRCGCRLVVRVCCWHVQFLCSIWLLALRFCWTYPHTCGTNKTPTCQEREDERADCGETYGLRVCFDDNIEFFLEVLTVFVTGF